MPSSTKANTKSYYFVEKSTCHKISSLNAFPPKFRVQDNFYVLCQFLASARFQLIVSEGSARRLLFFGLPVISKPP